MKSNFIKQAKYFIYTSNLLRRPLINYRHRGLKDDDVLVGGYPRSGSTWFRFMLFSALTGRDSSFQLVDTQIPDIGNHNETTPKIISTGRLIKTHEPYRPSYRRAIYIYRDARMVAPSEYKYLRMRGLYHKDYDTFLDEFMSGSMTGYLDWASNIKSWLNSPIADTNNLHLVDFNDLKTKTHATLKDAIDFLGVDLSDERIDFAISSNNLEHMKNAEQEARETINRFKDMRDELSFINKGKIILNDYNTDEKMKELENHFQYMLRRLGYLK